MSTVADYFTPADQQGLAIKDLDFGTAGTMVLPPPTGSSTPQTAVELAKNGVMYVVPLDSMGHVGQPIQTFRVNSLNLSQSNSEGLWGAMAFYNNTLYLHPADGVVEAFSLQPDYPDVQSEPHQQGQPPCRLLPGRLGHCFGGWKFEWDCLGSPD